MPQDVKADVRTKAEPAAGPAAGATVSPVTAGERVEALEAAFRFRGDVTLTLDDGSRVEGYLFDRRPPTGPHIDTVRLMPSGPETTRVAVEASRIRTIALSSRDPAAGKSWESWVRRYAEKKLKGERAEIQSEPLDEPPAGTVRG